MTLAQVADRGELRRVFERVIRPKLIEQYGIVIKHQPPKSLLHRVVGGLLGSASQWITRSEEFFPKRIGRQIHYGCFVCGGPRRELECIASPIQDMETGRRILSLFPNGGVELRTSKQTDQPHIIVGACDLHRPNLIDLFASTKQQAGYHINPDIVSDARMPNSFGARPIRPHEVAQQHPARIVDCIVLEEVVTRHTSCCFACTTHDPDMHLCIETTGMWMDRAMDISECCAYRADVVSDPQRPNSHHRVRIGSCVEHRPMLYRLHRSLRDASRISRGIVEAAKNIPLNTSATLSTGGVGCTTGCAYTNLIISHVLSHPVSGHCFICGVTLHECDVLSGSIGKSESVQHFTRDLREGAHCAILPSQHGEDFLAFSACRSHLPHLNRFKRMIKENGNWLSSGIVANARIYQE
ncbi:MAG: hypothetical protein ABIG71_03740 [Candidatus Uhrbacteria bacterium]